MIVMKFGGTSVGIPDHFRVATGLVAERAGRDPVVVVSALAGVTNLLVEFCRSTVGRAELAREIESRHLEFARAVAIPAATLEPLLRAFQLETEPWLASHNVVAGADRDRILSFGERLSVELFAAGLRARGVDATALNAGDAGLTTDDRFGAAQPLPEAAAEIRHALASGRRSRS
jgi:aspartate kinase